VVKGFGWVSIVLVLDCYTKKIVGNDTGRLCTAPYGRSGLGMAVNRQY
jgi:hypothetical protein